MKKRNEEFLRVIVYLSARGRDKSVEIKERNQLKVLKEYAKAHNMEIVKIMHRNIQGISVMNYHLSVMANEIKEKNADGVLVKSMASISTDTEDAYRRAGRISAAGGVLISVDEGKMRLPMKVNKEGKLYE